MREQFEEEYKKHEKALFLIAAAYLHNTEDAKDALQDAALSAYCAFGSLKNREYFKTWITRIVINKCKNFLKRRRVFCELDDSAGAFYTIPETELELMDAICRLESAKSVYIALRFYNDMTYEEMAQTLKLPVSTVKYRTKSALEELKALLEVESNES